MEPERDEMIASKYRHAVKRELHRSISLVRRITNADPGS